MIRFKRKKAQQLIEFLLAAPFLIIILGIITEYAYALNVNMTVSLGLKAVTTNIYKKIKPGLTAAQISTLVLSDLNSYLSDNNVTTTYSASGEQALSLQTLSIGDNTIFVASYRYYPAFTLPKAYFKILPDQFDFVASSVIPSAFLKDNSAYNLSTASLPNNTKQGIMTTGNSSERMLFFVQTIDYSTYLEGNDGYLIKTWDGTAVMNGTDYVVLKAGTDEIYSCSSTACSQSGNLSGVMPGSLNSVIFVHDSSSVWLYPPDSGDLSDLNVTGVLKRAIALTNNSDSSVGNYDNADVSNYNQIFPALTYRTTVMGSVVVAYDFNSDQSTIDAIQPLLSNL